jgi:hypothetical protein
VSDWTGIVTQICADHKVRSGVRTVIIFENYDIEAKFGPTIRRASRDTGTIVDVDGKIKGTTGCTKGR